MRLDDLSVVYNNNAMLHGSYDGSYIHSRIVALTWCPVSQTD